MYAAFYKLKKEPFHITPDPEFLFLSPSHKEALGSIIYGVGQRKGFILITGEVGVGKTTIIRSYLDQADRQKQKILYIFNANVTFHGLLKTIHQELGITTRFEEVFEMVNQLHEVLIEEYRKGCNVVLIIDEAQNMPAETLENLRMLSNLETSKDKLIQIVFSGQPEFERKLDLKNLRQLRQRIAVRAIIRPLTEKESLKYIHHRLAKASAAETALFSGGALRKIIKEAGGIPRIINILCENAFITAMGYRHQQVTTRIAREVIADFEGSRGKTPSALLLPIATVAAVLIVAAILAYNRFDSKLSTAPPRQISTESAMVNAAIAQSAGQQQQGGVPTVGDKIDAVGKNQAENQSESAPAVVKIVKNGDTLSRLAKEVYGYSSRDIIAHVKSNNESIRDVDRIVVGDRIIFPAWERKNGKANE